jgi:hypothetical protein
VPDAALWYTLEAVVEVNAILANCFDVAMKPFCFPLADLVKDFAIYHGCLGEEASIRRRNVLEVSIEEDAKNRFWDPAEEGFLAENVKGEKDVDDGIARNDPFIGPSEHFDLRSFGIDRPFECFDTRGTSSDYENLLAFCVFTVELRGVDDFAFEFLLAGEMRHLRSPTGTDGSEDTVEVAIRGFVDDPAVLLVFIDFGHTGWFLFESISFPENSDLVDDLGLLWVTPVPIDRGIESIHDAIYLQTRRVVYVVPDATNMIRPIGFEEGHVEAMANTMAGCRHASQSSTDDSYLRTM